MRIKILKEELSKGRPIVNEDTIKQWYNELGFEKIEHSIWGIELTIHDCKVIFYPLDEDNKDYVFGKIKDSNPLEELLCDHEDAYDYVDYILQTKLESIEKIHSLFKKYLSLRNE